MNRSFSIALIAPEKVLFEGNAVSVVAPCDGGYLGVLADHAPLVAKTVPGTLRIMPQTGSEIIFEVATPGFLEVRKNQVTFLLNTSEIKKK